MNNYLSSIPAWLSAHSCYNKHSRDAVNIRLHDQHLKGDVSMRSITLTKNQVAWVDDEDYPELNQNKWYAHYNLHTKSYYAMRRIGKKIVFMHRVINNTPDGVDTDHVDGNSLHNWRSNLRNATVSQNQHNKTKQRNNTSGYKGVSWNYNGWEAKIHVNGKTIHMGRFNTPEEAAIAYDEAAKKYHGEFANLNFNDQAAQLLNVQAQP